MAKGLWAAATMAIAVSSLGTSLSASQPAPPNESDCDLVASVAELIMVGKNKGQTDTEAIFGEKMIETINSFPEDQRRIVLDLGRSLLEEASKWPAIEDDADSEAQVEAFKEAMRAECAKQNQLTGRASKPEIHASDGQQDTRSSTSRAERVSRLCVGLGAKAESLLLKRASGISLRQALDDAYSVNPRLWEAGPASTIMRNMIYEAYREPIGRNPATSASAFGDRVTLTCLQGNEVK